MLLKCSSPLSKVILSLCIEAANTAVIDILSLEATVSTLDGSKASGKKEQGSYEQFTPKEKLQWVKELQNMAWPQLYDINRSYFMTVLLMKATQALGETNTSKRLPKERGNHGS